MRGKSHENIFYMLLCDELENSVVDDQVRKCDGFDATAQFFNDQSS
jgi:hypothetical protein